jgi:rsbT co-antagonist protein RsbR
MDAIGRLPIHLNGQFVLEGIQETIMVADLDYRIQWLNSTAVEQLGPLFKLYGVENVKDAIGMSMDMFHAAPSHQQYIMKSLETTHRARINIKDQYVAETIIHPIYDENGEKRAYLLMLLDVTTQANAEKEREKIIEELSTPILKIWDNILAVPIVGKMDETRGTKLAEKVLEECSTFPSTIHHEALRLIGTKFLIVGISAEMALSLVHYDYNWTTFASVRQSIACILQEEGKEIVDIKNSPSDSE